jgi:2-(1,2-epoxy-1,2-dihydrophenyl)acetyl-CoA isomerase
VLQTIQLERQGGVAVVKLNRPDVLNSVDGVMAAELLIALEEAGGDPQVRCILLTGAGRAFCAGQDLADLDPLSDDRADEVRIVLRDRLAPLVAAIMEAPKPIVAGVNGVAAGAGANLAFCCDLVVASEKASFIQSFVHVGLIPDCLGTYSLPRLVGPIKAKELAFFGEKVRAEEALQIGLVNRVYAEEHYAEEVMQYCHELARRPTAAIAYMKQAFRQSMRNDMSEQLYLEEDLQVQAASTEDYTEGVRAFLEKRKPNFQGR